MPSSPSSNLTCTEGAPDTDKQHKGTLSNGAVLIANVATGARPNAITGSITPPGGGTPLAITESYDPTSGAFTINATGYVLTGTLSNGVVSGTCTTPSGPATFVAMDPTSPSAVRYCGTYSGIPSGALNVFVSGTQVLAVFTVTVSGHADLVLTGSLFNNGGVTLAGSGGTGTGQLTSGVMSGAWTVPPSWAGVWNASVSACGAAG